MSDPTHARPVLAALAVAALTLAWGYVRLMVFPDLLVPLTFVVPMLVCVWSRRAWHVWSMAAVFAVFAVLKTQVVLPADALTPSARWAFLGATWFNLLAGATVIHAIIRLRERIDERSARLAEQNLELDARGAELAGQNEEIKAQAEELAQQNEEIEAQSEELAGQNEDLQDAAERLANREEMLQMLLEAARTPETGRLALAGLARRALTNLGAPAECLAVLKIDEAGLRVKVQAACEGGPVVPDLWPREGSIGGVVLAHEKTAYLSDLAAEPGLAAPFGSAGVVRSIIATPMRVAGVPYGIVAAGSSQPGHWTQEQFHILEWVSAQCGLIAESLRWQTALAERAREIEAANQAKDQFLAMLSHELRTPLTPVLAAAGVLEKDPRLPADVREDLAMIGRNIAIQSRLVDDLLDVTRLGRGKLELELHALDLAALLRQTVDIVGPDLDAKNQQLVLDLAAAENQTIRADGPRLQQVFWNLLKNANKFSPTGSRIQLTARRVSPRERRVTIEVIDQGIGIDGEHLDRIFLPFEQVAGRGRSGSNGGLGLGLAIAKAIVEMHGGRIAVSSAGRNRGACFTVELPLAPAATPVPSPTLNSQRPWGDGQSASLRILLVEDHVDTGRVLARLLRNFGYEVEHAESAGAALQRFAGSRFDLLISDLGLPDESGIELMRRLRALRPDLVGICLSGFGTEQDRDACREAGFAEHLTKPVDLSRLQSAIVRNCGPLLAKH